jgi:hypothetical protein
MMAAVFLLETAALALAWRGSRGPAIGVFFLSLALAGTLFALHATDPLGLSF